MADNNSLKVMCIFEACARLRCRAELTCLAAHLYHRFFRVRQEMNDFELNTFAAASIKLAHWFFEREYNPKELCIAIMSIIHGPDFYITKQTFKKLERSIDLAAQVIAMNIDFQINFKDTKLVTPGDLAAARQQKSEVVTIRSDSDDDNSSDDEAENEAALLLANNDKYQISSHRYLVSYLKTINLLVDKEDLKYLRRVANTAWSILCDLYWSPTVTQRYSDHWACVCLMMGIETWRKVFQDDPNAARFLQLIDKKWNLIFCDNLSNEHLERDIYLVLEQYQEFERALQQEFNTFVIDPRCSS